MTNSCFPQKNHAGKKYLPYAQQEEEAGERQNDQRKNVQKFMRIEGKNPFKARMSNNDMKKGIFMNRIPLENILFSWNRGTKFYSL